MIRMSIQSYGNVREFKFVEDFEGGGQTTSYYPALITGDGVQLDVAQCPDPGIDVPSFRKLLDRWNAQSLPLPDITTR